MNEKETVPLIESSVQIVKAGKLPASREPLAIPFNIVLEKSLSIELFETYHGVNINVRYILCANIKRKLLRMISSPPTEIFVESRPLQDEKRPQNITKEFLLTPKSDLVNNNIDFEIKGRLDSTSFPMEKPVTGNGNNLFSP